MNKLPFFYFILLLYFISAVYTSIVKLSLSILHYYDFLFIASFIYVFLNFNSIREKQESLIKLNSIRVLKAFLLVGIFFIIISFLNYITVFNIHDFNKINFYVIRQSYFIFYSIIGIGLFISIKKNFIKLNIILKYSNVILLILFIAVFFSTSSTRIYSTLFPVLFLLSLKINKHSVFIVFNIIVFFFYSKILLVRGTAGMTNILTLVFFIMFLIFNYYRIITIIKKYRFLTFLLLLIILYWGFYYIDILHDFDDNFWWRMVYWKDNFNTLTKTYFFGVGFGTPYDSSNLTDILGTFIEKEGLNARYIVAQHSALVNVLYRMGIVGFVLFITFNFYIIKETLYSYKILTIKHYNIFNDLLVSFFLGYILSFINISLNVGLASPRVFISYLIFTSLIISVNYNAHALYSRDELNRKKEETVKTA